MRGSGGRKSVSISTRTPSSSGLATLTVPILAPLGEVAWIGGDLVVTPTAAVVMGGLALGEVPYDRWVRFVWKLILIFFLLTLAFLAVSAIL